MFDSGCCLYGIEPTHKIAEIRIAQSFLTATHKQQAVGHRQSPHNGLRMFAVFDRFIGPNAQHYRLGCVPMSVQMQHATIVSSHDASNVAGIFPSDMFQSGHFLDQAIVVRCQQRKIQCGQSFYNFRVNNF